MFVDAQCPFAWITHEWLAEAQRLGATRVVVELMSLSCVNEHNDLDPDYRAYNDDAWAAARVAAALLASPHAERWPHFYATFGRRRHVEGVRDNRDNIAVTLRELDLPAPLARAADDPSWDDDLRARTRRAHTGVDAESGTPITRIGERAWFGPVLTAIPRGDEAVHLWQALERAGRTEAFASIATERSEHLDTGL